MTQELYQHLSAATSDTQTNVEQDWEGNNTTVPLKSLSGEETLQRAEEPITKRIERSSTWSAARGIRMRVRAEFASARAKDGRSSLAGQITGRVLLGAVWGQEQTECAQPRKTYSRSKPGRTGGNSNTRHRPTGDRSSVQQPEWKKTHSDQIHEHTAQKSKTWLKLSQEKKLSPGPGRSSLTQQQKGEKNKSDCKIEAYRLVGLDLKEYGIEQGDSVRRAQEMTFRKQHRGKQKQPAIYTGAWGRNSREQHKDYQSTSKINRKTNSSYEVQE
jgi:hypothetical protein